MAIVDLKSVSRVTIRLVAGIAIADVLTHTSAILAIGSIEHLGTPYCATLAAITTLDRHLYSFTNIAISYHLYRFVVQLKKPSFKAELIVWIAIVVSIAIIMITYHFLGVFTGIDNKKACNPGANNPVITKVVFGLIGLFNFLAIISGIFATVAGHKNLGVWIETFSNKEIIDPKDQEEFKAAKRKETQRSFLYPLTSLITLSAEYNDGVKGILTLSAFLIDPATQLALKHTFNKLRNKKDNSFEMNDI
ncbi:hypothetical protein CONCODRAFT_11710 [Conidiobolus coronatus NRRL 28638]|uniref:G-protein coupled receptors family 1 profile domain-containing protein n=1 Tax=Conidiobolus coronatus (strain ATCC 28846 / CBS 209.66 / NRRL 28638) TaxID=796925 RepID=A0A137NV27_CONC2|nr:hypothetical protein CONCODRAFT_11710 [Conidiobolus coronatus NRRL 28638]|eukprot:KXN66454.1 hypothetical protein CONCODRAFT_11710 [Conidiobolus coronatus NRRL 28638]